MVKVTAKFQNLTECLWLLYFCRTLVTDLCKLVCWCSSTLITRPNVKSEHIVGIYNTITFTWLSGLEYHWAHNTGRVVGVFCRLLPTPSPLSYKHTHTHARTHRHIHTRIWLPIHNSRLCKNDKAKYNCLSGILFKDLRMYLWWSLCTMYLHTCQVRVTVGNSGLCCCITYFVHCGLTPLCVDSFERRYYSAILRTIEG